MLVYRKYYEYTSKDVVPHNLWLLENFDYHINVEICSSLKNIKYLLWYPFEGDTRVIGSMGTNEDEISYYEDMRTVGATEAFWRIYEFELHTRFPTVVSLAIHLEDEQNIYFEDDTNLQQSLQNPSKYTHLTSFFLYNEQHHDGVNNQVTYMDFPLRFAWKYDVRQWNLRQNQNPGMKQESIGRLPALTPAHGDVFYLRSLLCHDYCKGKRSFDDLKMYNGNIYSTFKEVCFKIGLLRGDLEWRRCLEEASLENTARRMRALFATIIVLNRPADVNTLLFDFSDQLGEDISRDAQEYNIPMEPETFVYSVVVLTERELGSMNVAKEQNENIFGENFMIHEERAKLLELLKDIEEAKQ